MATSSVSVKHVSYLEVYQNWIRSDQDRNNGQSTIPVNEIAIKLMLSMLLKNPEYQIVNHQQTDEEKLLKLFYDYMPAKGDEGFNQVVASLYRNNNFDLANDLIEQMKKCLLLSNTSMTEQTQTVGDVHASPRPVSNPKPTPNPKPVQHLGDTSMTEQNQTVSDVHASPRPVSNPKPTPNPKPGVLKAYKVLKYIAVVNLILAIACIVFGSACIGICTSLQRSPLESPFYDSSGIWAGVLSIITFSLGIAALGVPAGRRCLLISYFVMLIISSLGFGTVAVNSTVWAVLGQKDSSGIAIFIVNIILSISAFVQILLSIITCSLIIYIWICCRCQPATVRVIQQPIEYHVHPVQV